MPEGAEYRREQRLERERGEGEGRDCCLGEGSEGVGAPAWEAGVQSGGRGERRGKKIVRGSRKKRAVGGDSKVIKMITESERYTETIHL